MSREYSGEPRMSRIRGREMNDALTRCYKHVNSPFALHFPFSDHLLSTCSFFQPGLLSFTLRRNSPFISPNPQAAQARRLVRESLEFKQRQQRTRRLQYIRHRKIPAYAYAVPGAEWNQMGHVYIAVQPAIRSIHVVICSPDLWIVVEDII
jgi:hypothetical protein